MLRLRYTTNVINLNVCLKVIQYSSPAVRVGLNDTKPNFTKLYFSWLSKYAVSLHKCFTFFRANIDLVTRSFPPFIRSTLCVYIGIHTGPSSEVENCWIKLTQHMLLSYEKEKWKQFRIKRRYYPWMTQYTCRTIVGCKSASVSIGTALMFAFIIQYSNHINAIFTIN